MKILHALTVASLLTLAACGSGKDVTRLPSLLGPPPTPTDRGNKELPNSNLAISIWLSDLGGVKTALKQGADAKGDPREFLTPAPPAFTMLGLAALRGHKEILEALLDAGAGERATGRNAREDLGCAPVERPDQMACYGIYALAVLQDRADLIELYSRKAPDQIEVGIQYNWSLNGLKQASALWLATHLQKLPMVQALVKAKAGLNPIGGGLIDPSLPLPWKSPNAGAKTGIRLSPMAEALRLGNRPIFRFLLAQGASPDLFTDRYYYDNHISALYFATALEDQEAIDLLLQAGATSTLDHARGDLQALRPMSLAILRGNQALVRKFLGFKPNLGWAARSSQPDELGLAIQLKQYAIAADLVAAGADVNLEHSPAPVPLHLAMENQDLHAIQWLLSVGASPNRMSHTGQNALHLAVQAKSTEMLRLLLTAKPDLEQTDSVNDTQATPLLRAIEQDFSEGITLLLQAGANPNARQRLSTGKLSPTPLFAAIQKQRYDLVNLLLQFPVDPNLADSDGHTPLMAALSLPITEFKSVSAALKKLGADFNAKTGDGYTALHLALITPAHPTELAGQIQALLESGALVDSLTLSGSTPLMLASGLFGPAYPEVVKVLLERGADVSIKNQRGQTARSIAISRKQPQIVEMLCKADPQGCLNLWSLEQL